jgi:hypothetical protein
MSHRHGTRFSARLCRALAIPVLALSLSGCDMPAPNTAPPGSPTAPPPVSATPDGPSSRSAALSSYYTNLQSNRLTYGLLRTDGGGADTPFTGAMLLRNFEQIAFYDEYVRGPGSGRGSAQPLRRWETPVRIRTYFGAQVPDDLRSRDAAAVAGYAARLGRATGHPISVTNGASANFHVFIAGEDDRAAVVDRIRALEPGTGADFTDFLLRMPRNTYCIVLAYGTQSAPHVLRSAIVLIRAELPELMRRSCIHEEIAQGLGLLNDSPEARPSIFNDDDEFALLTTHDEALLRLLYDPRLRAGQPFEQVRPIILNTTDMLASPGAGAS